MKSSLWLAMVITLGVGLSIGTQATLINRTGQEIGAVRTGLLIHVAGGTFAGLLLLAFGNHLTTESNVAHELGLSRTVLLATTFIGFLSIVTITGFAYSLQITGVSATLSTIIFGQMVVGTLADTMGWTGSEPIPLNNTRLLGLVVLALATFLLMPRE